MSYCFGDAILDTQRYELQRAGKRVKLRPKVFDVLLYLMAHGDRVVSKQELLDHVWPDQFVSEAALSSCIKAARQAIGDSGQSQHLIQTLRGRGYRFIAALELREAVSSEAMQVPEAPVSPSTPTPSALPLPEEEYKSVTVLMAAISDARALSHILEPEERYGLMQRFGAVALEVVQHYGGSVQHVLDDGIVVLFGVPVAYEAHARQAVLAAVELRRRWAICLTNGEVPGGGAAALRMGLHSGQVVVGPPGADQRLSITAVSDTLHGASRLQQQAAADAILLSEVTAQRVHGEIELQAVALGPAPEQFPRLQAHLVLGVGPRRSPLAARGLQTLSRFVGRRQELSTLQRLWRQAAAGRGQVVGLVGEPGMGKSRLVYEFRRALGEAPVTYLAGRCVAYGPASPYLPILDIVRQTCGIVETDPPEVIAAKVHQGLLSVGMAPEEWAPYVLCLLGVSAGTEALAGLSPQAIQGRIVRVLAQLCLNVSRQRPLVLEVEDLHWLDAASEACLSALVQQVPGVPILVLVTYRSGYQPPWMDKSYATQLALQPLGTQDSACIVESALAGRPASADLMQRLVRTAEGNPFFLEELARAVVERDGERPSVSVPETIQAVLTARMDRLPREAKRLLQMAAVIGKEVSLGLLQALVEVPQVVLDERLFDLQGAEFLYPTHHGAGPAYTFKHALTREVAYQSLLRRTRRQVHGQIARVLEAQFPEVAETQPELLAHHWAEAGLMQQAVAYGHRAGEGAFKRSAFAAAIDYLNTALERLAILPDTPERARQQLDLQLTLSRALSSLKGYAAPEAEHHLAQARQLCEQLGETSLPYIAVLRGLSRAYYSGGDFQKALEVSEELLRLAQNQDDLVPLLVAHRALGITLYLRGEFSKARQHFEQNLALHERIPQHYQDNYLLSVYIGTDLGVLAQALWMLGFPDQALERSLASLNLPRSVSRSDSTANVLNFAGIVSLFRRETQSAWELNAEAIALTTEYCVALQLARGIVQQGVTLSRQGQHDAGLAQIENGLTAFHDTGAGGSLTMYLCWLAEAYERAGRFEAAQATLTEAIDWGNKRSECFFEAELYRLQGEILLRQTTRDEQQAETCFRKALDVARRQQAKSFELCAATSLARLWQSQGKRQAAYNLLAPVYGWFTEGFDTADLQEAKALLAELQGSASH